jgi:hypothetical protein
MIKKLTSKAAMIHQQGAALKEGRSNSVCEPEVLNQLLPFGYDVRPYSWVYLS